MNIKEILGGGCLGRTLELEGWVKSHRKHGKNISFVHLVDGSTHRSLQIIHKQPLNDISVGSAVMVKGEVVESTGGGQKYEFLAEEVMVLKEAVDFPIQKKSHTMEWLRENPHLRHRTDVFTCVNVIKNRVYQLVNEFFGGEGFVWIQAPIITGNSCEGGAEAFEIEGGEKFFRERALLSVSGQFHAEAVAAGMKKVYTFGPTFRAEKSNSSSHLAEFWMIEPEISFCDLDGLMDVMERFMVHVVRGVLGACRVELEYMDEHVERGLIGKLEGIVNGGFHRMEYRKAVEALGVEFGEDLSSENERKLVEMKSGPVFVYNYPKKIKSFYMKEIDGVVVSSVDLLVPGVGELMGGSERESSRNALERKAKEMGISLDGLKWYSELRNYGYYSSAGFGCGFERLVMYVTGMKNIRDIVNYPRAYGLLKY